MSQYYDFEGKQYVASPSKIYKPDALIVGGGPVGLVLSLLLEKAGVGNIYLIEHRKEYTRNQILYINADSFNKIISTIDIALAQLIADTISCYQILPPFIKYPVCYTNALVMDNYVNNIKEEICKIMKKDKSCFNQNEYELCNSYLSIKPNTQQELKLADNCRTLIKAFGLNPIEKKINYVISTVTSYMENTLESYIMRRSKNITLVKPTKKKFRVVVDPIQRNIMVITEGDEKISMIKSGRTDVLSEKNVLFDSKIIVGSEGFSSIIRKYIICPSPVKPIGYDCMETYGNGVAPSYGGYFILDLRKLFEGDKQTFGTDLEDDIIFNDKIQHTYRLFRTRDGKIYIGLRIDNSEFDYIRKLAQSKYYTDCYGEYGVICKFEDKTKKNTFINGIQHTKIFTKLFGIIEEILKINFIRSLPQNRRQLYKKKSILEIFATVPEMGKYLNSKGVNITDLVGFLKESIIEFSIFNASPVSIKYPTVSIYNNDKLILLAGDSIMGVHFFTGTGVNTGFEYAYEIYDYFVKKMPLSRIPTEYNTFHQIKKTILDVSVNIVKSPFGGGNYQKYSEYKNKYMELK